MSQSQVQPRQKLIGVPLHKAMQKDADGTLLVRGYFTSDRRDEVGDIITRAATERAVPKYRQWGNIRYMHMPRPVAKVQRIGIEDGLEWNEVEIKVIDPQAVFEVENGLLAALSVGILVNPESIELLQDGGWVINDYALAEISLVDHPANYDAYLKGADTNLRMLVREYGFDAVALSMKTLLDRENDMDNDTEKDAVAMEPVVEPVAEAVVEEAVEAEVSQEAETPAEPVAQEAVEAEQALETESPHEDIPAEETETNPVDELRQLLGELRSLVGSLSKALETSKAVPAEAQVATEQSGSDEVEKALETGPVIAGELTVEETAEEEAGAPADRKGFVLNTEALTEGDTNKDAAQSAITDLRQALHKHFETRIRR